MKTLNLTTPIQSAALKQALTAASAVDAYIGTLANATIEPLSDAPHSDGSHVTLDARNVDHWSRNHGR